MADLTKEPSKRVGWKEIGEILDNNSFDYIGACIKACEGINPEAIPELLKAAEDIIHQIRISEPNCLFLHEQAKQLEAAIALAGKWGN